MLNEVVLGLLNEVVVLGLLNEVVVLGLLKEVLGLLNVFVVVGLLNVFVVLGLLNVFVVVGLLKEVLGLLNVFVVVGLLNVIGLLKDVVVGLELKLYMAAGFVFLIFSKLFANSLIFSTVKTYLPSSEYKLTCLATALYSSDKRLCSQ